MEKKRLTPKEFIMCTMMGLTNWAIIFLMISLIVGSVKLIKYVYFGIRPWYEAVPVIFITIVFIVLFINVCKAAIEIFGEKQKESENE